jgi:predicted  nucleic acid-binding Zn-ribbon protein
VKDLHLELQSVSSQSGQLTSRLYDGQVSNPKELQDIEHKIAELKRRHAELENDLLETMLALEDLQGSLAQATAHLREIESSRAAEHSTLDAEQHRLKREYKTLKTEREAVVQTIEPDNLELYQALRVKRQGHAVAILNGETCSGCRVSQTTVEAQRIRQGHAIHRCSSCGRILIAI